MSDQIRQYFEFGEFRLDVKNPGLWRGDELIAMSPKALDVLILLVSRKGEIVSREELIDSVWKDTFVEEGNINYTISLLRKIFENKELIQTIPRRGYRFRAPVKEISLGASPLQASTPMLSAAQGPKKTFRWVFASIVAVGVLGLTGFGYFWNPAKPAKNLSPDQNTEAMQTYLRGKMILENRSVENREEKAIDEFERAVTLDPTLAIAYAGLAEGFATRAVKIPYPKSRESITKAKVAADKALALEPNLAEGYMIRGWLSRNFDWDWAGAESDLRHSIELNPKSPIGHQRLAQTLAVVGRLDEALSESQIAYDMDPVSEVNIGSRFPILEARREFDEALKESEDFWRENKGSNLAARAVATFRYHKNDYQRVIEIGEDVFGKAPSKTPFAWLSLLAASYLKTGQTEKAADALMKLEALSQDETKATYSLAMNFAESDRIDDALQALEQCYERHEERLAWINTEPRFVNLRNHARFQKLLAKMNLN